MDLNKLNPMEKIRFKRVLRGTIEKSITANTNNLLLNEAIKGTIQTVTQDSDGNVTKIQHINSNSIVIREDNFTYDTNLVTEVRTIISSGTTITFKYHTDTLNTEVI